MVKKAKNMKKLTMHDIAGKSGVGIRTVNRVFAGHDVRFSSITAILDALDIDLNMHLKVAA